MKEAVDIVKDGNILAIGGFTLYRKPMAFLRELSKRNYNNLTVLTLAGSIDCDILIGSGVASTVRSCYVGMEYFGLAPNFRRFVEKGRIKIVEETELTIGSGLKAALQRVPFLPVRQLIGTDILKIRKDIKEVICPYTGTKLVALPALKPDVAVIHVLYSDPLGNAYFKGNACVDREITMAADNVILTSEFIVNTRQLLENKPEGVQICSFEVDAVVHARWGAHPTSCYPLYTFDAWHILDYLKLGTTDNGFQQYLETYIYDCSGLEDYINRIGGVKALERIEL